MLDHLVGVEQEIVDDDDRRPLHPDMVDVHPKLFMQERPDLHAGPSP
jgi:hypothetical protein